MREIDKFYQNPINLPLPVMIGAMYSLMKFNGSPQTELDAYRTKILEFIARQETK